MRPYIPANGTEGMIFFEHYCDKCIHDKNQDCKIIENTMIYDTKDPEYPKEWQQNEDMIPFCTKFEKNANI